MTLIKIGKLCTMEMLSEDMPKTIGCNSVPFYSLGTEQRSLIVIIGNNHHSTPQVAFSFIGISRSHHGRTL